MKESTNPNSNVSIFLKKPFSPNTSNKRCCSVCLTRNTPLWRRNAKKELVCNACGLYQKANNNIRPDWLKKKSKSAFKLFPNLDDTSKIGGGQENQKKFQWNHLGYQDYSDSTFSTSNFSAPLCTKPLSCLKCGSRSHYDNLTWRNDSLHRALYIDCRSNQIAISRHIRPAFSDHSMNGVSLLHSSSSSRPFQRYLSLSPPPIDSEPIALASLIPKSNLKSESLDFDFVRLAPIRTKKSDPISKNHLKIPIGSDISGNPERHSSIWMVKTLEPDSYKMSLFNLIN